MDEGWNREDQPGGGTHQGLSSAMSLPPLFNEYLAPTLPPSRGASPILPPLSRNRPHPIGRSDGSDAMVNKSGDEELNSEDPVHSQDDEDEHAEMTEYVKVVDGLLADISFKNYGSVILPFVMFVQSLDAVTFQRIEELEADNKRRRQEIELWNAKHVGKEKFIDVSQDYTRCCTDSKIYLRKKGLVHLPQGVQCICERSVDQLYCNIVKFSLMLQNLRLANSTFDLSRLSSMQHMLDMQTEAPIATSRRCVIPALQVRCGRGDWVIVSPGYGTCFPTPPDDSNTYI